MSTSIGLLSCLSFSLLVLLLAALQWAQPCGADILFGRTIPDSGRFEEEGRQVKNGVQFFFDWLAENRNGSIVTNDSVSHKASLFTWGDSSSESEARSWYRIMSSPTGGLFTDRSVPVQIAIGPWSSQQTTPAIQETRAYNVPFVFAGASIPAFYNSTVYPHAVGLLVQTGKRTGPCIRLFAQQFGVQTAAVIATEDPFQLTARNIIFSQLVSSNITMVYNITVALTTSDFSEVISALTTLRPQAILLATGPDPCIAFMRQLRAQTWQPNAIYSTNSATVMATYGALGWPAHGMFAGTQWSPLLQYTDPIFGTTEEFSRQYRQRFNVTPTFLDAANAMVGFVAMNAFARVSSQFTSDDLIQALHSTNIRETFMGPIEFLPSGELNQDGLCEQLLPGKSAGNTTNLNRYEMRAVAPASLAIDVAAYPAVAQPPPIALKWHKYSDGASIAFMVLAIINIIIAVLGGALAPVFAVDNPGRMPQYWVILVIVGGVILSQCTIFVLPGKATDNKCIAQLWLLDLGVICVVGVLAVKAGASLRKLLMVRFLKSDPNNHKLDNIILISATAFIVTVGIVVLGAWTAVAPPTVKFIEDQQKSGTYYPDCSYKENISWLIGAVAWVGALLLIALVIAIVNLRYKGNHVESNQLFLIVFVDAPLMILFVVLIGTTQGFYRFQFVGKGFGVAAFGTSTVLILFVRMAWITLERKVFGNTDSYSSPIRSQASIKAPSRDPDNINISNHEEQ